MLGLSFWDDNRLRKAHVFASAVFLRNPPLKTYGKYGSWVPETLYAADFLGPATDVQAAVKAVRKRMEFCIQGDPEYSGVPLYPAPETCVLSKAVAGNGFHHVMVGTPDMLDSIVWPGDDEFQVAYRLIRKYTSTPVIPDWVPAMFADRLLGRYVVLGATALGGVYLTGKYVVPWLKNAIKSGTIQVPGVQVPNEMVPASFDEYLRKFGNDLAKKIFDLCPPLHRATDPDDPRLKDLLRKPYRAQASVAQGLVKALESKKAAFLIGEMGVGKSFMALASSYLRCPDQSRTLILCPSHLVGKWEREVRSTVPGAVCKVLSDWKDALGICTAGKPSRREFVILSKETAKLGFVWRPAAIWDRERRVWTCPDCGKVQGRELTTPTGETVFVPFPAEAFRSRNSRNSRCSFCGSSLWCADNRRLRKTSAVTVLKRGLKVPPDLLIADELQEYKGNTMQGNAFFTLLSMSRKAIGLTGTLAGGYASDLFNLLYALNPGRMKEMGFPYGATARFAKKYGSLERIQLRSSRSGNGKNSEQIVERPGINLQVFGHYLLDSAAFIDLEDIAAGLPQYTESVEIVSMDPALKNAYEAFEKELRRAGRRSPKDRRALGRYVQNLLAYPDRPFGNTDVCDRDGKVVAKPPSLPENVLYAKEKALLKIVADEARAGRRVCVYVTFTEKHDVAGRLEKVLSDAGHKVRVLRSSVRPQDREAWLAKAAKDGCRAIICNAELVKTGLDLYEYPTMVFYQCGYNLFTLRQASRRSWRIGQTQPVKVVFMAYADTLQDAALRLMGQKLAAAQGIEGRFSGEGLRALGQIADVGALLAKALLEGFGNLPSAETYWRQGTAPVSAANALIRVVEIPVFGGRRKKRRIEGITQLAWDFAETAV